MWPSYSWAISAFQKKRGKSKSKWNTGFSKLSWKSLLKSKLKPKAFDSQLISNPSHRVLLQKVLFLLYLIICHPRNPSQNPSLDHLRVPGKSNNFWNKWESTWWGCGGALEEQEGRTSSGAEHQANMWWLQIQSRSEDITKQPCWCSRWYLLNSNSELLILYAEIHFSFPRCRLDFLNILVWISLLCWLRKLDLLQRKRWVVMRKNSIIASWEI